MIDCLSGPRPLLAQNGLVDPAVECLLIGEKRTKIGGTTSKIRNGIQWDCATKWDKINI